MVCRLKQIFLYMEVSHLSTVNWRFMLLVAYPNCGIPHWNLLVSFRYCLGGRMVQTTIQTINYTSLSYQGVSKNRGTPKWMVYNGKTLLKWMIWGYHYFGNTHHEFSTTTPFDFPLRSGTPCGIKLMSASPPLARPGLRGLKISPRVYRKTHISDPDAHACP